jgi:hypothetical protein
VDPSCTTFIQCSWSEPYVRDCNPGLLFNPNSKICDFPANVECDVRIEDIKEEMKVMSVNLMPPPQKSSEGDFKPKLVCFYPNWSFWRKGT